MPGTLRLLLSLILAGGPGMVLADSARAAFPGVLQITTRESVNEVEAQLRQALKSHDLTLLAVIDHAQGAADAGAAMQPTLSVLFDDPETNTPWITCQASAALDLPHTMVIRQEGPFTRIEWNDPYYLVERHDMQHCDLPIEEMAERLKRVAREAAGN